MWSDITARWPRRWRLYVVLSVLPVLTFALIWWTFWPRESAWPKDEPQEGFYWSAVQYQIAFGKLREQLLIAAAAGPGLDPVNQAELERRAEVLWSKGKILTEASNTRTLLMAVPGFEQASAEISRFDARLSRDLHKPGFSAADAKEALKELDALDPVVVRLANAARKRELDGRTAMLESLNEREHDSLLFALAGWAVAMGWLGWILLAYRDKQNLAHERLRALDAERVAKEQLQQAVRTKSQFLSMVSHELRSPLQAILSSVDVLELHLPPAERLSAIKRIRRSAMVLGVQLRDLLTIAHGEAGKLEIRPESFEAGALVEDVADIASQPAREKGINFRTSVPDAPVFARADVQRISQVLANLVSNAVKYTAVGEVFLALEPPVQGSDRLVFVVSDTGPGLPERAASRLKAPPSSDEELRPREDGSGIGLTIVKTVVQHLGGTIDVTVTKGAGTRFMVSIPVVLEDPDAIHTDATANGLVLVVDDRGDISASLVALVRGLGHPCHVADSAAAAAQLLSTDAYETVLIDLDMPVTGGVELARQTRRNPGPNQCAYLVGMSASRRVVEEGLFDETIDKPIERLRLEWVLAHRSRARKG